MSTISVPLADPSLDHPVEPGEFIRAAMEWHFNPRTGAPFWLDRAGTLDFDPRTDVRTHADLGLFPDVTTQLRQARVEDLVPRGYGDRAGVVGVYESGGTTGRPKRVVLMRDWMRQMLAWNDEILDAHGFRRAANWLGVVPTGPHLVGEYFRRAAARHGALGFCVDLDPRWVKQLVARGAFSEVDAYTNHLVDQVATVLQDQDIGVLTITPPVLERLARRDDLVELVNRKVHAIRWGGTQLDPDARYLLRTEVFPDVALCGIYGSTMMLGFAVERPGLAASDPCVFDPFSPHITFSVVDAQTREPVGYGERGRVLVSHVSRSFLLPNNLERDIATRVPPLPGQVGDSVADLAPVATFENEAVIEGVY
ncbi:MAG TPA: AMP-binding protein [Rugosimonospora sp.]|nr:AMP-binding protein [Rugosimonospora sp.]